MGDCTVSCNRGVIRQLLEDLGEKLKTLDRSPLVLSVPRSFHLSHLICQSAHFSFILCSHLAFFPLLHFACLWAPRLSFPVPFLKFTFG